MATVEVTHVGFETLVILERYMSDYIQNPEQLSEQLLDIVEEKLSINPQTCPVCPELEAIGVTDYQQLTIEHEYKVLYRYESSSDTVFVTAFLRAKQSAERLMVRYLLLSQ